MIVGAEMVHYRFYYLDAGGHIMRRQEMFQYGDTDAAAAAIALDYEYDIEIWELARRAVLVHPHNRSPEYFAKPSLAVTPG